MYIDLVCGSSQGRYEQKNTSESVPYMLVCLAIIWVDIGYETYKCLWQCIGSQGTGMFIILCLSLSFTLVLLFTGLNLLPWPMIADSEGERHCRVSRIALQRDGQIRWDVLSFVMGWVIMVCEVAEYLILSILLIKFLMEKDVFLQFSLSLCCSLL